MMSKFRTANLMGALAMAIADRIEAGLKTHPNQNDSAAAALNLIAAYEGCSVTELSQSLHLSHPAAVRLVAKLEAAGLLESRAGADKRTNALFLRAAGHNRVAATLSARQEILGEMVELLSSTQRRQLDDIAETLLAALTRSPREAGYICRLCDEQSCPGATCPVHLRALAMAAA